MKLDKDKFRGALLGLAAGDALGTTVEFSARGTFSPMTDIIGGGPFELKAGEWTDDTSMALCLAESLRDRNGIDLRDQLDRYLDWWLNGHNSVTGDCFDIGNTVRGALENFKLTDNPHAGSTHPRSAGNGSIMRLAPAALFYASSPEKAIEAAAESSKTTHGAEECLDACRLFCALIVGALHGKSKSELLNSDFYAQFVNQPPLASSIYAISQGSYKHKPASEIRGSGYVVESLEAALWAFSNSDSFEAGALLAVNLGDDADTTGAVYGQIAGAYYGMKGIPKHWLKILAWRKHITQISDQLYAASQQTDHYPL